MTTTEDIRQKLIDLTIEQDAESTKIDADRAELDRLMSITFQREDEAEERKREIRKARQELKDEETRAESRAQAGEVDEDLERLKAKFQAKAEGYPWYEGTGDDDAIMDHQWQAIQFGAVAKRWICGDGVGLGKTREAVGWLDLIGAKKVLIIAEANIVNQFAGEVMVLAPHRHLINLYSKTPAKRHELMDEMLQRDEAVVMVNYEIWRKDKDAIAKLLDWEIDTIIVDEAHNLKSIKTANFRYVKTLIATDNVCPNCHGHLKGLWMPEYLKANPSRKVAQPCPACGWKSGDKARVIYHNKLDDWLSTKSVKNICLTTGTPILNSPEDIYPLLHFCDPILFESQSSFLRTYCLTNVHSQKWEFKRGAVDQLKPLIRGRLLARSLAEIGIKLPKQRVHVIPVDIDKYEYPKQYRTIRQITEAAQIILESGEAMTIMHMISVVLRKRQANVWPGGIVMKDKFGEILFDAGTEIDESVKLDVIQEKILELDQAGHRQIVFSQFKTGLAEFAKRLTKAGLRVARFDGDTPDALREEIKNNFYLKLNETPKWDVVLANYKTGGTGLNFTSATATHIVDEEWNPGKRNQSYGRNHRIGQTRETDVYVYRIRGTIDIWMSNTIRRKEDLIDGFNSTMKDTQEATAENLLTAMKNGSVL